MAGEMYDENIIVVIAGNHDQYEQFRRKRGYSHRTARYIHREDQLRGLRGCHVALVGTYWENPIYGNRFCRELLANTKQVEINHT